MPLAVNDAGDVLTDVGGKWMPATRAVNDTTGESLVLDGGAWKPVAGLKAPPAANAAPPTFNTEFGPTPTTLAPEGGASGATPRIAEAGAKGAAEGFGNPIGQTILMPEAQAWMDEKQRAGGVGGFLAKAGSTAAEDIGTVGGVIGGGLNAAFRGAQGVVAQTGAELGAPQLGRDIAAVPEAFMGSPEMLQRAGAAPPTITAREVQARDGVGIMEAWRRAHAENTAPAAQAVAAIGTATDIDGAIAAAGKAAQTPGAGEAASVASEAIPTVTVTATAPDAASIIPKTSAEAKAVASAYYQQADQIGGTLLPEFTNKFIDKAESIAPQTPEGRAIAGDTAITGLVDRIQALRDEPISLQGAQEIDERLGDLIDSEFGLKGLSKEGRNLLDLQTTFRNMILDAGPEDTVNGVEGFEAIKRGRIAWAQAMKMMDFERILNRADQTDNPVTSIRAGIRTLTSNPARVRGYSPEELEALKDAANRGAIGSVLHVFGSRLTPLAVGAAGLHAGIIPGLIGAGITHGATTGMRNLATRIQLQRADNAMSVLGSGVPPMPAELSSVAPPMAADLPAMAPNQRPPLALAAD